MEVGFEQAEECFDILCTEKNIVIIRQTAGMLIDPSLPDGEELDDIGIYPKGN